MVALDVFIGLVLIYFLYSLLGSIIAEIFSNLTGMRARMLRKGIENLLNDKQSSPQHSLDFIKWIKEICLVEIDGFAYSTAGKFYREPTIKYMAKPDESSLFFIRYTKPAYITKENFTHTIINMVSQRSLGINEWDKIKFAIKHNTLILEPETLKMFQNWVDRSNDSFVNFITNVERTYEEMMDRVNDWYKRKIGIVLFIIGLILCSILNIDTIQITKILIDNPDKRKEMVELAISAAELNQRSMETNNYFLIRERNEAYIQEIKESHKSTMASIEKARDILAQGWNYPNWAQNWIFKIYYILLSLSPFSSKFWGILITSFALGAGGQFWYDLLRKLIALKSAVVKSEKRDKQMKQKLEIKKIRNNGLTKLTKDPVQIAISENREYWESLPGFISVNEDLNNENKKVVKLTFEKEKLPRNLNPIIVKNDSVEIKTIFGKKGVLQNSEPTVKKGMIHQPYFGTWGTPSGIVFNTKTNRPAILSCGHVIRSGYTSFIDPTKSEIEMYIADGNSQIIGNAHYLVMSSYCDAGLIDTAISPSDLENIYGISKIEKCRKVNYSENGNTKVRIHTKRGNINGIIIQATDNYSFDDQYKKDLRYLDLIRIGRNKNDEAINEALTLPGDSGSLICDENKFPIAILVGASEDEDGHFSYGIKLSDVFDILQIREFI